MYKIINSARMIMQIICTHVTFLYLYRLASNGKFRIRCRINNFLDNSGFSVGFRPDLNYLAMYFNNSCMYLTTYEYMTNTLKTRV